MATSSSRLIDEINDQFLICKICYDVYKQPKTLSCLHTFCSDCLEKHQEAELERSYRYLLYSRAITCPVCRKKTDIPVGGIRRLPDNFLVANLSDIVNRRKPSDRVQRCEICKPADCRTNVAVAKCLDCCKFLCRSCLELHKRTKVTQSHGLFDVEVEKDIECKVHQDEVVRFYCEPCEMCICVVCTFQEHKGHEVASFTEGIEKYRHSLDALLVSCRQRIEQLKEQLQLITKCETDIKQTEQQITEVAIESISAIRKREREMVRDLYLAYGEESVDFIKEKEFMQESIESLQSTCNLTDIILKDRSVELLLLKKEIQQKLNLLLQRKWLCPPDIVKQHVQFVPGRPELGYLQFGETRSWDDGGEPDNERQANHRRHGSQTVTVTTQTRVIYTDEVATSMGRPVLDFSRERVTQTDVVLRKETGTLTYPGQDKPIMLSKWTLAVPETQDHQTMTVGTPTMKRKIQTETVRQTDRETNTSKHHVQMNSVSVNTQTADTAERSTMTKIRILHAKITSTDSLIRTKDSDTCTEVVTTSSSATETVLPDTHNKGTLTYRPFSCDKKISTPKRIYTTQQTNTPHVTMLDMGILAKVSGHDVGVTTKTTVTTNTGTGESDVSTADASVGSEATGEGQRVRMEETSSMTEAVQVNDQMTFTAHFNMADSCTETDRKEYRSADMNTTTAQRADSHTNTDVIAHEDKAVNVVDKETITKVDTLDSICQTMISIIDAVLWPSMLPVSAATNTELAEVVDRDTSTDHVTYSSTGVNTGTYSTADVGVGDNCCTVADVACDPACAERCTLDVAVGTESFSIQDQASCTDRVGVSDMEVCTEVIDTKDASHEAFRGYLTDAGTNTDVDVVVKPLVGLSDNSTNTTGVHTAENGTNVAVLTRNSQTETSTPEHSTSSTNTEPPPELINSVTSTGAGVHTKNTFVNTVNIELTTTGCGVSNAHVTDATTCTDRKPVASQQTETEQRRMMTRGTETFSLDTADVGVATEVTVADVGTDVKLPGVRDQDTSMDPVLQSTVGVGTNIVRHYSKGTATDPPQTRDLGTYTYVQSVEKATYMPHSITVTTGTSTKPLFTSDKSAATDRFQLYDSSTNTTPTKSADKETTMSSQVLTSDGRTNTDTVEMVDSKNDPITTAHETRYTNTPKVELSDAEVCTPEVFTLSTGTTTQHRVLYADQDTITASLDTRDQTTATAEPEKRDRGTGVKPATKTIGILKRPHTITRGTGTLYVKLCSTSTSPHQPYIADQGTMARADTENKATCGLPFDLVDHCTGTAHAEHVERCTEMIPTVTTQRGCSPIRQSYTDRSSSPVNVCSSSERETSPVSWPVSHKSTTAAPASSDRCTSTVHIELSSRGTDMPPIVLTDRASSPVQAIPETKTVHRGTSMPQLVKKDEASVARPDSVAVAVNTGVRPQVDRASTPIRCLVHDQGTNTAVCTDEKEVSTPQIATSDKCTSMRRVRTTHSSTSMPQVSYLEKETSTPKVHIMHKNTSTENMTMVDKQTNTVGDITAAYRQSVVASKPVTVNRGTAMPEVVMFTKETSPITCDHELVERASSPIRTMTKDKAVSVKKGEILEPVDTYQSAGGNKKSRKARPRPRLASIEEDSSESSVESLEEEPMRTMSALLFPPLTPVSQRVPRPKMSISGLTHKERLWPSTPRMGKYAVSAFNSESRPAPSLIICKVDIATNTKDVAMATKATSTDCRRTSDKSVSTEFLPVETKMAECISKLKTVRNRLEQKQPNLPLSANSEWNFHRSPRPTKCPTLGITMRSKSLGDSLNDSEIAHIVAQTSLSTSGSSDGGSSSQGDSEDKPSGSRQKARKQRLDINQLLRSSSLPERNSPPALVLPPPPTGLTKPKIQTVYPQVIPKLNVDEFKLKPKDSAKKSHGRPSPSLPRKPSPKRRPNAQNNEPKKNRDHEATQRPTSDDIPPDPPKRSSSLRHALLTCRNNDGSVTKKDDIVTNK